MAPPRAPAPPVAALPMKTQLRSCGDPAVNAAAAPDGEALPRKRQRSKVTEPGAPERTAPPVAPPWLEMKSQRRKVGSLVKRLTPPALGVPVAAPPEITRPSRM